MRRRLVRATSRGRRDGGAVVLIVTLVMSLVLLGVVSLVVDLGLARDTRIQAQKSADSAVLASANALYQNGPAPDYVDAVGAAKLFADQNFGVDASAWTGCSDAARPTWYRPGGTSCISFDSRTNPTRVRVKLPVRPVETPFSGIWNVDHVDVGAEAEATISTPTLSECGVCILGPGDHALAGAISADDFAVAVNGTLSGTGSIRAKSSSILLEGPRPPDVTFSPSPQVSAPPTPDPLAYQALPDVEGLLLKSDPCSQGPGLYNGATITSATCTLSPGLYVFIDDVVSTTSQIVANGVTLYFGCSFGTVARPCNRGERGAGLRLTDDATLTIRAPSGGPTARLAVVSDRENTSQLSWRGDGSHASTGTIYALSGSLDYGGNAGGPILDSLIVVGDYNVGHEGDVDGHRSTAASQYSSRSNVVLAKGDVYLSR